MKKLRFLIVDIDGITYMVTNFRSIKGIIKFKTKGFWKFLYKKFSS